MPIEDTFSLNGSEKAWYSFYRKTEPGKGHVILTMLPFMRIESASRLKNKILDEVKQLPEDGYHNIIILDISHHLTNFEDADSNDSCSIDHSLCLPTRFALSGIKVLS